MLGHLVLDQGLQYILLGSFLVYILENHSVREWLQKFQNLQAERTKNALDFLKIDLKSYEISQRITSHDPVFSRRVIEQDLNLSQNIEKREISEMGR
jgi:hypothetical protein